MKTSLAHLPENKQQELQRAVEIIREETELEMLILFGSYARGDWVEDLDPDTLHYRYQSDFDLLIVTETLQQANKIESNNKLTERLLKAIHRTPVSLIAEDIHFVNKRLRKSQYFYIDVKREGIILFDSGKFELADPVEITVQERKKLAQEDFEYWFGGASGFLKMYNSALSENELNIAAFLLHQVTERLYSAILLVFTRYKPSSHDLTKLARRVASAEPQFLTVFPQSTEEERARFKLLRKAYVDARYKPSFSITKQELTWLAQRVDYLQALTEKLCREKIASFV
ncbi:HEPN domain-containing protein [Thalassomonas actiniarum]|uniref:HEPN domain-containing protein n=1 Tax=Thalassomonas actiniarum TaxID=485447 RepID=A0AAE9YU92_9GAMM|nr:HEPN domain-containing protein [Thalassomonas actiniarum]WDD99617.1 HEPN domain-containing protein [Thalassomonas actiniarum]